MSLMLEELIQIGLTGLKCRVFFCYHGIQRPPALLTENVDDISFLSSYEILAWEPLHDITNVVQNIINE